MWESLFIKVAGVSKRDSTQAFPANFAKFLRTPLVTAFPVCSSSIV